MKIITIVLFSLLSFPLLANDWVVNKDHSAITFSVPYLGVSEVTGRFNDFKGSVVLESEKITQLDIVITADSLSTANRLRDSHLKANDFLNTSKYPEISFVAKTISSTDGKKFTARGPLTIHGVTKDQTIDFNLTSMIRDSWGFDNRFAKFSFSIMREDFNLKWNKTLAENKYLVGEKVVIQGTLQLQPLNSLTPGSKHFIPVTAFTRGKEKLKRGEISQEDFNKLYLSPTAPAEVQKPTPNVAPPVAASARVENPSLDFRNSVKWWIAFSTLGLLGFFSAIIIGVFAKDKVLQLFHVRYKEEGWLGNLSDIFVIGFTLIYSMAFWYVGWGH